MRKRVLIIFGIVCVLLILAAGLYFLPVKSTPINITMDAVKMSFEGENMGTVPITVHGALTEYLFHDDRLFLEISPIEDLYDIKLWGADNFNSIKIDQPDEHGFYSLHCNASSSIIGEDSYLVTIFFREDLSKWEFFRHYRIGANREVEEDGVYRELDFTYRATVE